jgi:hypothetical protein
MTLIKQVIEMSEREKEVYYKNMGMSSQERIDYEAEKFDKEEAYDAISNMFSLYKDEENVKQLRLNMINYLFKCSREIVDYKLDIEQIPYGIITVKLNFEKTKEEKIFEFLKLKYEGLRNVNIDKDFITDFYNEVMELKKMFEEEE